MQAQDTINRHWVSAGLSYSMPQLDGKPLPSGVSAHLPATVLRYTYGKEEAWFVRLQWRATRGTWKMDEPMNYNVSKTYWGMQWSAGVGRHWLLKKNWYAVTVLDGSWDRYKSEGSYGGGVTGQYIFYDTRGNMMGAGLNGGILYRINTHWSAGVDTRFMIGAQAGVVDEMDPLSSSLPKVSNSIFDVRMQWTPVQALYVSYRF